MSKKRMFKNIQVTKGLPVDDEFLKKVKREIKGSVIKPVEKGFAVFRSRPKEFDVPQEKTKIYTVTSLQQLAPEKWNDLIFLKKDEFLIGGVKFKKKPYASEEVIENEA